jgi:hypothetical protein
MHLAIKTFDEVAGKYPLEPEYITALSQIKKK